MQNHDKIDIDELFVKLGMSQRREAVRKLLTGNDAQCFTTEQYKAAYGKVAWSERDREKMSKIWTWKGYEDLAETHLRSVGMREIEPGLWAECVREEQPNERRD